MPGFEFGIDVGIDLGTSVTKIYTPNDKIVLNQPSVVAVDRDNGDILAIGNDAYKMLGRTSDRIAAVYPLREGVISNYDLAEAMLNAFVKLVCGNNVFMPRVVVCVPIGVTEVERRAVVNALRSAGARKVCIIDEVTAAALGAGVDIAQPYGSLVCDIGGGTTDIGVISLNGLSVSKSIKTAGNSFDDAIIKHIRKNHNLIIGVKTAEEIKKEIGCATSRDRMAVTLAKGRDARTGLPNQVEVTSDEIMEAVEEPCVYICRAVQNVLEQTPPELVSDLYERGMILTGGSSQLYGIDKMISKKTHLNVVVAHDPQLCVALGTGLALDYIDSNNDVEFATSPLDVYTY